MNMNVHKTGNTHNWCIVDTCKSARLFKMNCKTLKYGRRHQLRLKANDKMKCITSQVMTLSCIAVHSSNERSNTSGTSQVNAIQLMSHMFVAQLLSNMETEFEVWHFCRYHKCNADLSTWIQMDIWNICKNALSEPKRKQLMSHVPPTWKLNAKCGISVHAWNVAQT